MYIAWIKPIDKIVNRDRYHSTLIFAFAYTAWRESIDKVVNSTLIFAYEAWIKTHR